MAQSWKLGLSHWWFHQPSLGSDVEAQDTTAVPAEVSICTVDVIRLCARFGSGVIDDETWNVVMMFPIASD